MLKTEIESPPGRVRRLLRPRAAKEIPAGSSLDAMDVSEAEMLVEFVGACRTYADELAVNEATVRSYSDLQHYLESGTKILLDSLRQAAKPIARSDSRRWKRPFTSAGSYSADYAGLLARAAEIAVQGATAERKPARA